mgnify:CR=1 FL=1
MKTTKLTVSIPKDAYERIEREKKQKGIGSSEFIRHVLEEFFQRKDEEEQIKKYIEGYKKKTEDMGKFAALEKASAEVWGEF